MSALLVVVAFAGTAGALLVTCGPLASPVRHRAATLVIRRGRPGRGLVPWTSSMVAALGHRVRRAGRRPPDVAADRRAGCAVALAVVGGAAHPVLALVGACAPLVHHVWVTRRARRRAGEELLRALPDVVDLFRIAAGAGLTVHHAIEAVRTVIDGRIAVALAEVHRRVAFGERLTDALPELTAELGEPVRPLVAALVSAERDGAPLVEPLERVAWIARDVRRRHAEETARRVPVQLLFPLVACVLPAFALLTVVPLLAGTLRTLSF